MKYIPEFYLLKRSDGPYLREIRDGEIVLTDSLLSAARLSEDEVLYIVHHYIPESQWPFWDVLEAIAHCTL